MHTPAHKPQLHGDPVEEIEVLVTDTILLCLGCVYVDKET